MRHSLAVFGTDVVTECCGAVLDSDPGTTMKSRINRTASISPSAGFLGSTAAGSGVRDAGHVFPDSPRTPPRQPGSR